MDTRTPFFPCLLLFFFFFFYSFTKVSFSDNRFFFFFLEYTIMMILKHVSPVSFSLLVLLKLSLRIFRIFEPCCACRRLYSRYYPKQIPIIGSNPVQNLSWRSKFTAEKLFSRYICFFCSQFFIEAKHNLKFKNYFNLFLGEIDGIHTLICQSGNLQKLKRLSVTELPCDLLMMGMLWLLPNVMPSISQMGFSTFLFLAMVWLKVYWYHIAEFHAISVKNMENQIRALCGPENKEQLFNLRHKMGDPNIEEYSQMLANHPKLHCGCDSTQTTKKELDSTGIVNSEEPTKKELDSSGIVNSEELWNRRANFALGKCGPIMGANITSKNELSTLCCD
ncbi:hypothetical protein VP01_180g1 [Puccinia sorghi]|uniref:Uncharacterized protein n=1 Tax=Puccinia sorghi TaxID=27349 RepID=A0A0L6VE37_9BASI|nr:hypothetical protein VP01_180g1 [Puccinia sorghi]